MDIVAGSATIAVARPPEDVFDAIADVTRMGEWSPENTGGRWIEGATGPAPGARFEGDNVARVGPVTLKRWTTTSEITRCDRPHVIEFVTENHTRWRFELVAEGDGTRITQSFEHPPYGGWQKLVYETLARRSTGMVTGMQTTLERLKDVLEP